MFFFIVIYISLCVMLAQIAKVMKAGSATIFLVSLLGTPILGLLALLFFAAGQHDMNE